MLAANYLGRQLFLHLSAKLFFRKCRNLNKYFVLRGICSILGWVHIYNGQPLVEQGACHLLTGYKLHALC